MKGFRLNLLLGKPLDLPFSNLIADEKVDNAHPVFPHLWKTIVLFPLHGMGGLVSRLIR